MTEFRPSRFEILPPVIKNLLIINVLVFLAQSTLKTSFSFDDTFALHAWQSELFKPWQLITHMFMHGGWSHIFFNMFALWMFGSVLENVWGSKRFLTFYLISGLGAALIYMLFLNWELAPVINDYAVMAKQHFAGAENQGEFMVHFIRKYADATTNNEAVIQQIQNATGNIAYMDQAFNDITEHLYNEKLNGATVGASGAIFGVLAAFGYLFPNTYLYIYFMVPIKAKWAVIGYAAIEIYEGIRNSAGDNVAHWAHIGGAVVGLLIVLTWNKTNKRTFY